MEKTEKMDMGTKILLVLLLLAVSSPLWMKWFRRSSFVPNAPIPPPSSNPSTITFASPSGAFQGGRANQVWDGTRWVQVYGQSTPTLSDRLFAQDIMTPQTVDATICKCGRDKRGRHLTCTGFFSGGELVCNCCKKPVKKHG